MPRQSQMSIWKKFFLLKADLDSSDRHLQKIKKASSHTASFPKSFEEFSKNEGISFLILDPSETQIQLLHHSQVFGGNWNSPTKKLVAILGTDLEAKPVQIIQKSIKNIKEKSFDFGEFFMTKDDEEKFKTMDTPSTDYQFKNILPISNALTKIFVQLNSTSPFEVAKAFIEKTVDQGEKGIEDQEKTSSELEDSTSTTEKDQITESEEKEVSKENVQDKSNISLSPDDVLYAIQFCHLCATEKIPPVLYLIAPDQAVSKWFKSTSDSLRQPTSSNKRHNPPTPDSDSDSDLSSPELKVSKKDHYLINTMIKLHDTMDKSSKNKEDKEPGFNRLESHRKSLILNTSAPPPFTKAASSPTEFFKTFLAKKSQFKAKDMLMHRFHADKIAFNPNSTFVTNLWNSEFFWILPDSPSGISIFYCPETKSNNNFELEKERSLALVDKINAADIEKLAKQKNLLTSISYGLGLDYPELSCSDCIMFWERVPLSLIHPGLDKPHI
jgi:hypothetical protein